MILQRLFSVLILTCSICLSSCPGTLEMRNAKKSTALPLKAQGMKSGSYHGDPLHLKITQNVTLTVSLAVGSPPQMVTMVLDTGSELSYLRCHGTQNKQPVFDPNRSPSYSPVTCLSPDCNNQLRKQESSITTGCSPSNNCTAGVFFADLGSVDTSLAKDTISIAGSNFNDTAFGCMDLGSSSNPGEDSKTTGLMGMNLGSLSFVSQMGFKTFSYCISSSDNSGLLVLGDSGFSRAKPLNYTPLVLLKSTSPNYNRVAYTVNLTGIKVADKLIPVSQSAFRIAGNGAGQTMVDSGTQFTYLLEEAYTALKKEFLNQTKGILEEYPGYVFQGAMDLYFRVGSNHTSLWVLPSVTLLLEGAEIEIPGNRLLYQVPGDVSVYGFTFGSSQLLGTTAYIIGHYHQQNLWVEYDLVNSRIGLAHFTCNF
ncbi:unnamed protein product [Cuscuta epithymum]|uniref:Peptidase A1 domain-containing protein n=1 Tax=Cuscuta epithymum TaxID=186058 RepID=A0AAV0DHG0_9ASTE|nr:unnamed protein product [Cuscuta epithymum]